MTTSIFSPKPCFVLVAFLIMGGIFLSQSNLVFASTQVATSSLARNQSQHNSSDSNDDSSQEPQKPEQSHEANGGSDDNGGSAPQNPGTTTDPAPETPTASVTVDQLLSALNDEFASAFDQDSVDSAEFTQLEAPDIFRVIAESDLVKNRSIKVPAKSGSSDELPLISVGCFTACNIDIRAKLLPPKKSRGIHRCQKNCSYEIRDSEQLDGGEAAVFLLDRLHKLARIVTKGQSARLRLSVNIESDEGVFPDQEKHTSLTVTVK